jgi:hypothetical protein
MLLLAAAIRRQKMDNTTINHRLAIQIFSDISSKSQPILRCVRAYSPLRAARLLVVKPLRVLV